MRIIRYLKGHIPAILLICTLLIVQAFCELSLPNLTSSIVDVGIQQKGIEHVSPDTMRSSTYETSLLLASNEDAQLIAQSYDKDGSLYKINKQGMDERAQLDSALSVPFVMMATIEQSGTTSIENLNGMISAGQYSTEDIEEQLNQANETINTLGEGIVRQQALSFTQTEYAAQGVDLDSKQINYLVKCGLQMLTVTLVMVVAAVFVGLLASRTAGSIARNLRRGVFSKVVSFSQSEINRFSTASLITRSTNDIQQVQMAFVMMIRLVLYAPIIGIGGVIMVAGTNVSMSWTIALAVLVIVGIVAILFTVAMPKFKIMQILIDKVNLVSREIITGVPVIRAFGREHFEEERFDTASYDLMKTQLFTNRVMTFLMPVMMIVMNAVSVLIVWTASRQIDMGAMQVGDMIAFITYSMVIITSFLMLGILAIMLPRASAAAERIDAVMAVNPSICDPETPVDITEIEARAGASAGTVSFDHVSFKYGDAQEEILHDISFIAEPGKTTAIVGATGSGKSTLLNLIPRFYDVTEGSICIDGADLRSMTQRDLHALLGYVPQKGMLFSGTIEDNIKFGGSSITDEEMFKAAQIAQAADFIETKEAGYQDPISQGGTNISGGQRQRISIARALAKNPRILLFDDSFSALDYKTDMLLRQSLQKNANDTTIIIVAQRIASVLHADQIIVLEDGRMVARGTHEELMDTSPSYREIAYSQLSAAELKGGTEHE